jgi:hypothetical protein
MLRPKDYIPIVFWAFAALGCFAYQQHHMTKCEQRHAIAVSSGLGYKCIKSSAVAE